LTAAWCSLWRDISAANILGGVLLSIGVLSLGVATAGRGAIRPGALAKLCWIVLVDLIRSTVSVAVEIITPTDRTEEAIVAVPVSAESRDHLLLLIVAITLTPGTAVVDADLDTATLYLHVLHHDRLPETIAHVHTLTDLACQALPVSASQPTGATT
jgi:multicomponent Na+:H+ antiporter subunit E